MAPAPIDLRVVEVAPPRKDTLGLAAPAHDVYNVRDYDRPHVDPGTRTRADPEKKEGPPVCSERDQQKDELGLLIAERSVVFFRDRDISPQQQERVGQMPQVFQVPGVPGVTVIWPALQATGTPASFRRPGGSPGWHTDLVHERQPAGVAHLHNDTVPTVGRDTLWASGYAAYEKLSPLFRKFIDGKTAIYRSAHPYLDRKNPEAGPKYVEREHPIVRVHPATGWKALWVNRPMIDRIVGLDKAESDVILAMT